MGSCAQPQSWLRRSIGELHSLSSANHNRVAFGVKIWLGRVSHACFSTHLLASLQMEISEAFQLGGRREVL